MSCCFGDDSLDESLELLSEQRKYDDTEATCCSTKPAPPATLKVVKRGYLCVQDPTTWCKRWRRVYAVLYEQGFLVFGPSERDMVQYYLPTSQLPLYGSAVVFVVPPKIPSFLVNRVVLEINTPKRTLFLYAPTAEASKSWALAIQNVTHIATQALSNIIQEGPPLLLLRDGPESGSSTSRSSSKADVLRTVRKLTEKSESQRRTEEEIRRMVLQERSRRSRASTHQS